MDRVWDTSKYHPKLSVSVLKFKVIQGHEVNERPHWKFHVWVAWYMFFLVIFPSRTRKMTLEHFLNGPSRTKYENLENTEIPWTAWKVAFSDLQNIKTRSCFKTFTWNCVHIYTWRCPLAYIPVFENSQMLFEIWWKHFSRFYLGNFQNF